MIISPVKTEATESTMRLAGELLADHKCADVSIFDVKEKCSWTCYFAVATVSSAGHLRGVLKHLYQFMGEQGLVPKVQQKKIQQENWIFIDCGDAVFHIMDSDARKFYQLENLWHDSPVIYSS